MHVAIVGGGPAGAWTALRLARAGVRVTLFDGSHPREKPCGGGLTGRAVTLVAGELGGFPMAGVRTRTARFERAMPETGVPVDTAGRADVALPDTDADPALVIVSRAVFDRALFDAAGVAGASLVAERVTAIDVDAEGVTLATAAGRIRADVVVGADGANSLVRRRVAAPFPRAQLSIGAGVYVHGVSSEEIAIRWMAKPAGYLWSFPRLDHLAVGACAQATDVQGAGGLKEDTRRWLDAAALLPSSTGSSLPSGIELEPYSWPIPALGETELRSGALPLAGDRWLLVGDAAGLVDPLTREGIFYALVSGEMAAAALAGGHAGAAARYRQALAREVLPELSRAARLKAFFFKPEFSRLVVHALNRSGGVRRIMAGLIAGRQPYIGLERRLAATGRFDLALGVALARWRSWRRDSDAA